jgi:hypothetical protein
MNPGFVGVLMGAVVVASCGRAVDAPEAEAEAQPTYDPRLPPGGTVVPELLGDPRVDVDQDGVLWLSGCEGLRAVTETEIVSYRWNDTPLPEGFFQLVIDAQNRKWFLGDRNEADGAVRTLSVIDGGEWRVVYEGDLRSFSVNADGTAWGTGVSKGVTWVQQLYPRTGERIDAPVRRLAELAAGAAGSVWLKGEGELMNGVFHWADGTWTLPSRADDSVLSYEARADVLWLDSNPRQRLTWTAQGVEMQPLLLPPGANPLFFDPSGRTLARDRDSLVWISDGVVDETLPDDGRILSLAAGPAGDVYAVGEAEIRRYQQGEWNTVSSLVPFDEGVAFPWRAASFGHVLRETSLEASGGDLRAAPPRVLGKKLHASARPYAGYGTAAFEVDGAYLPTTTVEVAGEFSSFADEKSLGIYADLTRSLSDGQETWDLYGYLETGTCFPFLGSGGPKTRRFWIVEGYPASMPAAEREALQSELRERYPEEPDAL